MPSSNRFSYLDKFISQFFSFTYISSEVFITKFDFLDEWLEKVFEAATQKEMSHSMRIAVIKVVFKRNRDLDENIVLQIILRDEFDLCVVLRNSVTKIRSVKIKVCHLLVVRQKI